MRTSDNPSSHRIITLPMRNKREPTSGLEPLTCSLRVIASGVAGGCSGVANPAYLSGFFSPVCCVLHRIALPVVSEWYQEVMDYHSSNSPE